MPKPTPRSVAARIHTLSSRLSSSSSDGHSVHNEVLLGLSPKDREMVLAQAEFIEMRNRDLLNELGKPIENCYFVNSGLASILNVMRDGKSVEVGLAGKEGFIGLPLVVGLSTSSTRVVVQVKGTAFRVATAAMEKLLRQSGPLEKSLNRYSQELGLQATQVAACNRLHPVEQRMARWLLMSQDRIEEDQIPLTQEFLAHMLGTRRASVTGAAAILEGSGAIKYARGGVLVVDRKKLEGASCECYQAMTRQSRNWRQEIH